jgi:chromosomal replication initiator protein
MEEWTDAGETRSDRSLDYPAMEAPLMPSVSAERAPEPELRRDPEQAWHMVREDLRHSLSSEMYNRFVEKSWVVAYEDGEFIIGVPDSFAADWLGARMRKNLKRRLGRYLGRQSITVAFSIQATPGRRGKDSAETEGLPLFAQSTDGPSRSWEEDSDDLQSRLAAIIAESEPEAAVDRPDASGRGPASVRAANGRTTSDLPNPSISAPTAGRGRLLPDFTFDTFVVGGHNRLAHAAATAVADDPGKSFNPLFIYGGVGLGKTHLLHAIGNVARRRERNVLYRTSEQFTNELIQAIGDQSTDGFRERYRHVDVLLIDDIQFLRGKERTQEEFFHTFNHLHEAGSQIVLTSDRPPKALATLEERLRSRFEGGLQTDIAPPDLETRVAILEQKAIRLGMKVDKRILMAVAERFESNIRELEGALNQLNWQSQLARVPLTYESAVSIVDNLAPQRLPASPPDVIRIVAQHYGVTPEAIVGKSRKQPLARIRQITMYLLREENGLSLERIGDELGGRDHSTVAYGAARIVSELQDDDGLRLELSKLREKIYTPLL